VRSTGETIVLCDTMREAYELWGWARREHSDVWCESTKYPCPQLTSKGLHQYYFRGETEGQRYLKGFHGQIISPSQFIEIITKE